MDGYVALSETYFIICLLIPVLLIFKLFSINLIQYEMLQWISVYKTFYCIYNFFLLQLDFQSFHDWSKATMTLKVLDTFKTSVSQNRFLLAQVVYKSI